MIEIRQPLVGRLPEPRAFQDTSSGEPYRLYNLDVFEYELDSRMALYGSIPFMVSHSADTSVGVFWHTSAETWIDVRKLPVNDVVSAIAGMLSAKQKEEPSVETHWMTESGVMDVFVMLGDRPMDVFR